MKNVSLNVPRQKNSKARCWRDRPETKESRSRGEDYTVAREVFEKKASLQLDKGLRRYTQSAEDNSARTRQWTFSDKGSRYQVFRGGGEGIDGVVTCAAGEGREGGK